MALAVLVVAVSPTLDKCPRAPRSPASPSAIDPVPALPPVAVGTDNIGLDVRVEIARNLRDHSDFERDVIFLIASSIRVRCAPAHAHDLPAMAAAAHLPVLEGTMRVLAGRPVLRGSLYALIRHLASVAPCGRVLLVDMADYRIRLDPARYAAAFPDSYFAPSLAAAPREFGGHDLATRAGDACTSIGYALLPLDAERPWQCAGLRADLRRRLIEHGCGDVMREYSARGATAALPAEMQARIALALHDGMKSLPDICQ